ncbi:hypothetical protein BOTBODRAFT_445151 [Botryobasidium botryosum FD-172 SS1]|uniref:Uncharacterized protein n=1 Tax=Botryobasidium botryosum (strain FD-172 SS1) TaxID=930990 RepID=A0A067MY77_BOTB1|nr:hypothetical protein BOTBODRAFT_445151 [Botryobasidium botryosum FD-172 SS1]
MHPRPPISATALYWLSKRTLAKTQSKMRRNSSTNNFLRPFSVHGICSIFLMLRLYHRHNLASMGSNSWTRCSDSRRHIVFFSQLLG